MSIDELFPSRAQVLKDLKKRAWCDVLVIGGGIHGSSVAHLAAFNGLRTILLEQSDYAAETSSRSSKLAHGGLRYLELFDFRQVFEGIRAREDLFKIAPHLAQPAEFMTVVQSHERWHGFLLRCGLTLYGALSGFRRRHRCQRQTDGSSNFYFTDGIMRDGQLVLERIIAARQEGALCINHVRVERVMAQRNDRMVAHCIDVAEGADKNRFEIEAGVVMNCAGPFAGLVAVPQANALQRSLVFSRGIHILFDVRWSGAPQIIPIRDSANKRLRGRYYFILPYRGYTMVGTTERETTTPESDPVPRQDEIEELYGRLRVDAPHLTPERAYYAFAGVRALARDPRHAAGQTAALSRRHRWVYSGGVLSLLGGKYTNASATAYDGLRTAFKMAGLKRSLTPLRGRLLPGAAKAEEERVRFFEAAEKHGVSQSIAERIFSRMGARVRYIHDVPNGFDVLAGEYLRGELTLLVHMEQAASLEDIVRRRLELEFLPGQGLSQVETLCGALNELFPNYLWQSGLEKYRERVRMVTELLRTKSKMSAP